MLHWDLLTGWLPGVLLGAAAIAGLTLLAHPLWRRWWAAVVPAILAGSAAVAVLFGWLIVHVILGRPMPPAGAVVWIALMIAAIALAVAVVVRGEWGRRVGALVAAAVIVVAGLDGVNQSYEYYPTLEQALGVVPSGAVALPPAVEPGATAAGTGAASTGATGDPGGRPATTPGTGDPSAAHTAPTTHDAAPPRSTSPLGGLASWRPQGHMPSAGAVSEVAIPGTISGFAARPGWVYLPPAYLTVNRPALPVLVLIPGEPGGPTDWITYGRLARTMNAFADEHHGLAPVVVVPDLTGAHVGNTMCVDSALGNAGTYFRKDVIGWILANLHVDHDTAHWAVGGFSFGGTCALQFAVDYPSLFPTFLDISGEEAPTLGSAAKSISEAFAGDKAKYEAIEPLRQLAKAHEEPKLAALWRKLDGTFIVGSTDKVYGPQQAVVVKACRRAGMTVHATTYPGDHHWAYSYVALIQALPHVAKRMGIP